MSALLHRVGADMTHIIVLGTSHTLQCGHSSVPVAKTRAFEAEVKALIAHHKIVRIAEEMSSDGLAYHDVTETISARVACELGIEYHCVDLTQVERASLGLGDGPLFTIIDLYNPSDSGKSFRDAMFELQGEVRERVWTYRILNRLASPVLFVCGAMHVGPIARIWHLLGMRCDIAHVDYLSA